MQCSKIKFWWSLVSFLEIDLVEKERDGNFLNGIFFSSWASSADGSLPSGDPSTDQQGPDRAGQDRGAEPADHYQGLPRLQGQEIQPLLAHPVEHWPPRRLAQRWRRIEGFLVKDEEIINCVSQHEQFNEGTWNVSTKNKAGLWTLDLCISSDVFDPRAALPLTLVEAQWMRFQSILKVQHCRKKTEQ